MQLEKIGMAEDATVGFLKRQNLPSCFAGEFEPDQRASSRPERNLEGDSDQGLESQSESRSEKGQCKASAILEVSKFTTSAHREANTESGVKPAVWPWRLAQYALSRLVPSMRPVRWDKRSLRFQ